MNLQRIVIVAPNAASGMGGEGLKSLQYYFEARGRCPDTWLVTHARNRDELTRRHPGIQVEYIEDDALQIFLWKSVVLDDFVTTLFFWKARRKISALVAGFGRSAVVHYLTPISPVHPRFPIRTAPVIIGPLNGNIYFPPAFRDLEPWTLTWRRWLGPIAARLHALFFGRSVKHTPVLVFGGSRTRRIAEIAGYKPSLVRETPETGVSGEWFECDSGRNSTLSHGFVVACRLVRYKGTDLTIRALARTRHPVTLDIIGKGEEEPKLKALVAELGLGERVSFRPWADPAQLPATLCSFRALVFPSLAEALGTIVQQSLALGLPVVCVKWGGPALLVDDACAFVLEPTGEEAVISGIADAMDRLVDDPDLRARMSRRAVEKGRKHRWDVVTDIFFKEYESAIDAFDRRSA